MWKVKNDKNYEWMKWPGVKAKLTKVSKNAFKGCKNTITVKGTSSKANKNLLKKTSYKNFK